MRCAWPLHDVEEALPRLGIVAGGSLQGLDEAEQRSQRRAQLMARIGDEIGPHGLQAAGRGEIAEEQDDARLDARHAATSAWQGADMDLEGALGRNALGILDLQGLPVSSTSWMPSSTSGAAQGEGERVARLQAGQKRVGGPVGLDHDRAPVHEDHRIGNVGQHRLGDAGAGGYRRLRPGPGSERRGCAQGGDEQTGEGQSGQHEPDIAIAPQQRDGDQHECQTGPRSGIARIGVGAWTP